jgi:hypothetical protein
MSVLRLHHDMDAMASLALAERALIQFIIKDGTVRAARMARSLVSRWPLPPAMAVAVKSAPACPDCVRVALEAEVA